MTRLGIKFYFITIIISPALRYARQCVGYAESMVHTTDLVLDLKINTFKGEVLGQEQMLEGNSHRDGAPIDVDVCI